MRMTNMASVAQEGLGELDATDSDDRPLMSVLFPGAKGPVGRAMTYNMAL
jgi:hypothetical protein